MKHLLTCLFLVVGVLSYSGCYDSLYSLPTTHSEYHAAQSVNPLDLRRDLTVAVFTDTNLLRYTTPCMTASQVNPQTIQFINYLDTNSIFSAELHGVRDRIDFSCLLSMIVRRGEVGSNHSGQMRIWRADEDERMAIADLYLQHGADPNYLNDEETTTVAEAVMQGYERLALMLCTSKSNQHSIKEATILQAVERARELRRYWFLTGITKSDAWIGIGRAPNESFLITPMEFAEPD